MPLYRFSTEQGGVACHATEIDLASYKAAQDMACRYLGDQIKDTGVELFAADFEVRVADEDDLTLFTLTVIASEAPASRRGDYRGGGPR